MVQKVEYTVASVADANRVSATTVRRWIRAGLLKAEKRAGKYYIPIDGNISFLRVKLNAALQRPMTSWVPKEITEYDEWHQSIDEFCWLIKVCYSSKEEIKRKNFRLDKIFANYLIVNNFKLSELRRAFTSNQTPKSILVTDDLKRGWYNELAYSIPLKKSTLGLSFKDIEENIEISQMRFAFPSWRIVTAYYSVYFYLRACTLLKIDTFNLQDHGATISTFKHNLAESFERAIWKFPFNISYSPGRRIYRRKLLISQLPHSKFRYAQHPRSPNKSPVEIFDDLYATFRRRSRGRKRASKYGLFDYLHDFRIWANYLDIDNLLNLSGRGYKAFLDHDLSTILFFIGGIAELSYIAVFGVRSYIRQLEEFYRLSLVNDASLKKDFVSTPLYQRLRIYNVLGIIKDEIRLEEVENAHAVKIDRVLLQR